MMSVNHFRYLGLGQVENLTGSGGVLRSALNWRVADS